MNDLGMKIAGAVLLAAIAGGFALSLESLMPVMFSGLSGWVALIGFITYFLLGGGAAFGLVKTVAMWTSPIWIFGLARALLIASPLAQFMGADPTTQAIVITVTAPAIVSIIGWMYWRFARFQELARDIGIVLSLLVHIATIATAAMDGDLNRTVGAWAAGSLFITFILASSMYQASTGKIFRTIAYAMGAASVALALSLMVIKENPVTIKDTLKIGLQGLIGDAKEKAGDMKDKAIEKAIAKQQKKEGDATKRLLTFGTVNEFEPNPDGMTDGE